MHNSMHKYIYWRTKEAPSKEWWTTVVLKTIKREAKDILVAGEGEAECPYCALLHAYGVHDSRPTPCDGCPSILHCLHYNFSLLIVVWMKYFNLHCVSTNHVLCEVILSELLREPLGTKKIQTLLSNNSLWAVKREGCRVCSYHPTAHCCVG